ncbi:MAG: probable sulfite oxidase, partial [uncultured Nocardioidaceae bacterium]
DRPLRAAARTARRRRCADRGGWSRRQPRRGGAAARAAHATRRGGRDRDRRDPRQGGQRARRPLRQVGQAAPGRWCRRRPAAALRTRGSARRPGAAARPAGVPRHGCRRGRGDPDPAPVVDGLPRPGDRGHADLAGRAAVPDERGGNRHPAGGRGRRRLATQVPAAGRDRRARDGGGRRRQPLPRSSAADRRGRPGAARPARDRRRRAVRGAARPRRPRAVAHAERRLLPDRHRGRRPCGGRRGVAAPHPRHGRERAGADLPGPARPWAHRGVGDALLRLQPGGWRADRQRLVERRPGGRPAGRGPPAGRRRRGAADLRGRLDLRHPARGAHRRPGRAARGRHERRAAAARARLPRADGGAGALRLRLGDQVARRPRGHPLRRLRRLLDRQGVGRGGAGADPVADRRTPVEPSGHGGSGAGRRSRLGAAHGGREGRGPAGRRALDTGRAGACAVHRHLGAVGRHRGGRCRRAHPGGPGHRQVRLRADRREAGCRPRRRHRLAHRRVHRRV